MLNERENPDVAAQADFERRMLQEREAWLKAEALIAERHKDDTGSKVRQVLRIAFTALLCLDVVYDRFVLHQPLMSLTKSAGLAAIMLLVMSLYRKPTRSELLLGGAIALAAEALLVIIGRF